ncbi:MAG: glycosyltransferase, partial [Patescibacteria group bacterium]|nr:glycosyltransferase [Patescibacteria group bacterium]
LGIPLLQAMSCQVPIAASGLPVLKEVGGEAILFFNPDNVNSMGEALKNIITDDNLRERLIEKGKERVKNFSWEKCASETLAEINNLYNPPRPPLSRG